MAKKKIATLKNGPYKVYGVKTYKSAAGKETPLKVDKNGVAILCRCGQSFEKPYCDGSHIIFEFTDEKDPRHTEDRVDTYIGKNITIYDNRSVCSHRGICYDDLKEVFQMAGNMRIDPDGATVEKIIDICERCPSGALSYSLPEGTRNLKGEASKGEIRLAPRRYGYDGPIEVTGGIEFEDEEGNQPESPDHYSLCRCGASKNMPFCSGQHWTAKFIDESNDEEGEE